MVEMDYCRAKQRMIAEAFSKPRRDLTREEEKIAKRMRKRREDQEMRRHGEDPNSPLYALSLLLVVCGVPLCIGYLGHKLRDMYKQKSVETVVYNQTPASKDTEKEDDSKTLQTTIEQYKENLQNCIKANFQKTKRDQKRMKEAMEFGAIYLPSKQDVRNNKDECDKKIEKLKNFLKTATSSSSLGGNCLTIEEKGIIDNAINGNNLDATF